MKPSVQVSLQIFAVIGVLLLLPLNYLVFHVSVELSCALVALHASYAIRRNKLLAASPFYSVLAVTLLCVAAVDVLHLLAYKGMGLLPVDEANSATQFWILGRYILATGLVLSALVGHRQIEFRWLLGFALFFTGLACTTVFFGFFPDAYLVGVGLTKFKIISEYLIIGLLLLTILLLSKGREVLTFRAHLLLVTAIGLTILSELMFTLYQDVYGLFNAFGHTFKFISYLTLFNLFTLEADTVAEDHANA
jgi:hypothetical protein